MSRLLLAFIAIALVQVSYSHSLRARSTATQFTSAKSYLTQALQDVQNAQAALENSIVPPQTICVTGDDKNAISYGKQAGQFGTSDFSVGIWVQTSETIRLFDIIGNRNAGSHGNFFQIRMSGIHENLARGTVQVEIDQDEAGTNYGYLASAKTGLTDGNWHHIVATRQGTLLSLYIDGSLTASGRTNGVTNINGSYDFKIGRSLDVAYGSRFSPAACYSGPRTALRAWSASEVGAQYSSTRP